MPGFSVKDVLKLLCLILLAIPLCILGLVAFEGSRPSSSRDFGAVPALKRGLSIAPDRPVLKSIVGMSPVRQPDNWKLSGLAAASGDPGNSTEIPFVATLRLLCRNYWDETCWRFELLEFPSNLDNAKTLVSDLGLTEEQRRKRQIRAAQLQLRAQGLDPGPLDGVMGPQTERALKIYLAKEAATGVDKVSEADLTKLAEAADHQLIEAGYQSADLQTAMQVFLRVAEVDQNSGSAHYNRGRIYRAMGLGELAVAAQSDALARDPGDYNARIDRGHAQYQLGRYWAAFSDYRDGLGVRVLGKRYLAIKEGLARSSDTTEPRSEPLIKRPVRLQASVPSEHTGPAGPFKSADRGVPSGEHVPLLQDGNIHGSY